MESCTWCTVFFLSFLDYGSTLENTEAPVVLCEDRQKTLLPLIPSPKSGEWGQPLKWRQFLSQSPNGVWSLSGCWRVGCALSLSKPRAEPLSFLGCVHSHSDRELGTALLLSFRTGPSCFPRKPQCLDLPYTRPSPSPPNTHTLAKFL